MAIKKETKLKGIKNMLVNYDITSKYHTTLLMLNKPKFSVHIYLKVILQKLDKLLRYY